jgi:NTP pyrophosphatase (non-canonical NTP hydrolase)
VEIRDVQQRTWANKLAKGFNTSDVALEFGLLTAEVSEAFTAWRKRLPDLGEELADVCLYLAAIAEMNGIDLGAEVDHKLAKNERRVYRRDDRGVHVRVSDPDSRPG